jgi:peptidoglycan/xylan/chitin deacetylase (PgdA/CDA1 family)
MEPGTVFLMYHELEVSGRPLCQSDPGYARYVLSAGDFGAQMNWLKNKGWQGMSVGVALRFPREPGVAITFDDGCETDLLMAIPILQKLRFRATFYITVGFLGRRGYLSISQLREIHQLGFEIGCHSMTHCHLTDADQAGLNREIVDAKAQLEQIIGIPVYHFSCPGGRYNQDVMRTARTAGYQTVATSRAHANARTTDQFGLGRVAVMRGIYLQNFEAICSGRGLWQLGVRDDLRRTAQRLLGNSIYDRVRNAVLQAYQRP